MTWTSTPVSIPSAAEPLVDNLLSFTRSLRRAGLPIAPEQTRALLTALDLVELADREQVYHAARSMLVFRQQDLQLFDLLFQRFFRPPSVAAGRPRKAPRAPRHETRVRPLALAAWMASRAAESAPEVEVEDRSGTWSAEEILRHKDFAEMGQEELDEVRRLLQTLRWRMSERRTRRRVSDPRGDAFDLRRTLRLAARTGAVPVALPRSRRKQKERPVVLLADISGSMEKYSRLVLLFFHGLARSLRSVECFVFGTRLTRITESLALRNVDRALESASREVVDWSGGTRIGDSLAEFNRRWGRRVLRRGAVVVVVSDGWERGDADFLERQMRHLRHRCHHLIWLNPLLGREGYRPRVAGMSAALRHVDDFRPIHNLCSLEQLSECLQNLPVRRAITSRPEETFRDPRSL